MSRLIKKILLLEESALLRANPPKIFFNRYFYTFEKDNDYYLPTVVGEYSTLFDPEKHKFQLEVKVIEDTLLFNNSGVANISEKLEDYSLLIISIEKNYFISNIISNSNDISINVLYNNEERLLYTFYKLSNRNSINLTLQKRYDVGKTYEKITSDPQNISLRKNIIDMALNSTAGGPSQITNNLVYKYMDEIDEITDGKKNIIECKIKVENREYIFSNKAAVLIKVFFENYQNGNSFLSKSSINKLCKGKSNKYTDYTNFIPGEILKQNDMYKEFRTQYIDNKSNSSRYRLKPLK